jgi:hypothetical protein
MSATVFYDYSCLRTAWTDTGIAYLVIRRQRPIDAGMWGVRQSVAKTLPLIVGTSEEATRDFMLEKDFQTSGPSAVVIWIVVVSQRQSRNIGWHAVNFARSENATTRS